MNSIVQHKGYKPIIIRETNLNSQNGKQKLKILIVGDNWVVSSWLGADARFFIHSIKKETPQLATMQTVAFVCI